MKTLLKKVVIADKKSPHNGKSVDVLIEDGIIKKIADTLTDKDAVLIETDANTYISPGFVDLQASYCDPGYEHKETLQSGSAAAVKGGFTHVLVMPDTQPVVSGKTIVEYMINHGKTSAVHLIPCGSLSQKFNGEDLSEMYDMWQSGARAFYDVNRYVKAGLMSRAMLYAKNFGGPVFSFPFDPSLAPGGMMHEGLVATTLGMKGIPEIAEEIVVKRDIALAEYNEAGVHFAGISSALSPDLIAEARKKGIKASAHLPAYLLYFTDEDLQDFNTNLKLNPPLRTDEIRKKLIRAIADGKIDAIASHHCPQDPESKTVEFDQAEFGMIAQETAFSSAWTMLSPLMKIEDVVDLFSAGPRRILQMPEQVIQEGSVAELSFFNPDEQWVYAEKDTASASANTPFTGKSLRGKIKGVFCKGKFIRA